MNKTPLSLRGGPSASRRLLLSLTCAGAAFALGACGGGASPPTSSTAASVASTDTNQLATATAVPAAKPGGGGGGGIPLPGDPGVLLLLLPDNYTPGDARIGGWTDAALEMGVRMMAVTDTQFAAMGTGALSYAGLVLPDDVHSVATDATIAAVKSYVNAGGKALLSFDFGALTLNADGQPVYPIPKSRLSDMAGVDYVLYDELRDRTTGLGPVTGTHATLRQLDVPPGKSMVYTAPQAPAAATLAASTTTSTAMLRYLPVSPSDPGGVRGFDPQQFQNVHTPSRRERLQAMVRQPVTINYGAAIQAPAVASVTSATPVNVAPANVPLLVADPTAASPLSSPLASAMAPLAADTIEAISGYVFGYLTYPTYVTRGTYAGTTLATSPNFGLVAGVQPYGAGQVLFVNLPLSYLKGRTDAMPMHGFLGYFASNVLRLAQMSAMPDGIAGLTLNWHLDSFEAQAPTLALEKAGIFKDGPFSINMTAGPDTVSIGDGLGWNLDHNTVAQGILRRFDAAGHSIGSHGGWIHDYYGLNATEDNAADFTQYLVLNRNSVDGVVGHATREYSPPEGNSPTWAMTWLESQGVVGSYFGGHTGLGVTRQYRNGVLLNAKLAVLPVTPNGLYATMEEFQDFNVPKPNVTAWYHELVDFNLQMNTSRLIYMHPPGAQQWLDVTQDLLAYVRAKGRPNFRWYTMPALSDHLMRRVTVTWTQTALDTGATRFNASHPAGLAQMVWRLPKTRYLKPTISSGTATVADGGSYWLVKAGATPALEFLAKPVV